MERVCALTSMFSRILYNDESDFNSNFHLTSVLKTYEISDT